VSKSKSANGSGSGRRKRHGRQGSARLEGRRGGGDQQENRLRFLKAGYLRR
jgi:hypothetical protein